MKAYLSGFFLIINCVLVSAQQGLEGIRIEKYYISDSNDEKGSGGSLRAGSVTYRIFVDMKPGYKFQALYGVPGHPLKISTTTYFYNHAEGSVYANDVSNNKLSESTVMLDSWFSVGAASFANIGVLKEEDTTGAIKNKDGFLKNTDPDAGIALNIKDGLMEKKALPVVTPFGIENSQLNFFRINDPAAKSQNFLTENGSFAAFGGSAGPDSTNKVLIGQFTTDGQLSFEFNIQLGTKSGGAENYVARNPIEKEIQFSQLLYPDPVVKSKSENQPDKK